MSKTYVVKKGDCLNSIAFENDFFPDLLWKHAKNSKIAKMRGDGSQLVEGDKVYVPDKEIKFETVASDAKHSFKRKGVPAKLSIKIFYNNKPRAKTSYQIVIDGRVAKGMTDNDGFVHEQINPSAKKAKLTVGNGDQYIQKFDLQLGYLDPIDSITGVKERLANLGFSPGSLNGELDEQTKEAIRNFQLTFEHPKPTGELDQQTKSKLEELHDK